MKKLYLTLIFIFAGIARADELTEFAKIEHFSGGPPGFGGEISRGEILFIKLYQKKTNLEEFIKLYGIGNNQAKMYSLVAFRKLSPDVYAHLKNNYAEVDVFVDTMFYCDGGADKLSVLIKRLEFGAYDKLYNEKTKQ